MQSVAPCHDSLVEAKNLYLEHLDGKNLFSFDLRDLDRTGFSIKVASLRDKKDSPMMALDMEPANLNPKLGLSEK